MDERPGFDGLRVTIGECRQTCETEARIGGGRVRDRGGWVRDISRLRLNAGLTAGLTGGLSELAKKRAQVLQLGIVQVPLHGDAELRRRR